MTYTFKLSRRLAQLWHATVVAVPLLSLSCTGTDGGPIGPPPIEPWIVLSPDSTSVGVNQTVQFEATGDMSDAVALSRARRTKVVSLAITPGDTKLSPEASQLFSVSAKLTGGSSMTTSALNWSATGGTVDLSGKYTAGTVPGGYRVIAQASSGVADTAVVTIVALAGIIVTPASMALQPGATQQLAVAGQMTDSSSTAVEVTWTASGGTISPTGLYTAGPDTGSYRAIAVQVGSTLADTTAVTITAVPAPPPPPPPTDPTWVSILPGQSIQAAVNANNPGTTFLIKAGTHIRQSVIPKAGDTFRCDAGTIMDGENVTQYAFTRSGSGPDSVRIVGCIIQNYNPPAQSGAIQAGWASPSDGTYAWIVDSTEVRYNASAGIRTGNHMKIRWSNVHHNGAIGITGIGDTVLVENTEIAYNNYQLAGGLGWESGGTKFVKTNGLILRNNFVHHNKGPGLWLDIANINFLIEGNTVEDNLQDGIFVEISYGGVIRLNTCRRNGLDDDRADNWPWGAGILIAASGGTGIEIYGNTLTGNAHGISLLQQARGSNHGDGTWVDPEMRVQNINAHDNAVIMQTVPGHLQPGSLGSSRVADDTGTNGIYSRNNRFEHNTYVLNGVGAPFHWSGYKTSAQWAAVGQDVTGTFTP